ncbi:UDP-3-O-acyl N-acetylglucosamine deacetylase [Gammaproteobacteria bacterium]|nr:UDP-3-O-acyl N-acetylglucosamine deacetylase [Gammaproteobacteria bacterium]
MTNQCTIKNVIKTTGIGLHTGSKVYLTLRPAPINSGITFIRSDIAGSSPMKVGALAVTDTRMATTLSIGSASISTVEHLMSALAGLGIDNIYIEVSAPEIPIMDGSAAPFVFLIQSAGIQTQSAARQFIRITKPVRVEDGDKWAMFEPHDGYQLDFKIEFEHPVLKRTSPEMCFDFSSKAYIEEISRARTFGFMRDLDALREKNLALGGSLDNAIVIDDYRILNEDGLRYSNEFVRHKILDSIGDLYQLGHPIIGRFVGFKAGHGLNNLLIRELVKNPDAYVIESFSKDEKEPISFATFTPSFS